MMPCWTIWLALMLPLFLAVILPAFCGFPHHYDSRK